MELKKNPEADLEKKRPMRVLAGMVVALSFVLIAFEWKTFDEIKGDLGTLKTENVEEEIIPITEQEAKPPPPPPPPAPIIEIVEDDVEVEEVEIQDVEADQTTVVEAPPVIEEVHEVEEAEPDFFTIVEEMPAYPGGDAALMAFLQKNIKYPQIAKENGISGVVYVSFIVDKSGKVTEVKVVRGVDSFLDKEAIRVVSSLSGYSPGKQRGKPVPVQFTLPIRFQLN